MNNHEENDLHKKTKAEKESANNVIEDVIHDKLFVVKRTTNRTIEIHSSRILMSWHILKNRKET